MTAMQAKAERTAAEAAFVDGFAEAREALPGGRWLRPLREDAIAAFARAGLPHRRVEAWRYTDLRSRLSLPLIPRTERKSAVVLDDEAAAVHGVLSPIDRAVAVIVDGRLRPELSKLDGLGEGIEVVSFEETAGEDAPEWLRARLGRINPQADDAVIALNTAYMSGGVIIRVPAGVKAERPLHLAFVTTAEAGEAIAARNLIVLEEGAELTVLETHVGSAASAHLVNLATEADIAEGARLDHVRIQTEGREAIHLASLMARLGAEAGYRQFTAVLGAAVSRHQSFLSFAGEGAAADLAGATMLAGRQHGDATVVVDHAVPACTSRELFKSVVDDQARSIFQGKVIVSPGAQKSDGRQMSQGLLLSPRAEFTTKPELEIFADDVQCAHGATSGELDPDLLFYLRARGIPEREAKALLIAAFVGEAIDEVDNDEVREALTALAAGWLAEQEKEHGDG